MYPKMYIGKEDGGESCITNKAVYKSVAKICILCVAWNVKQSGTFLKNWPNFANFLSFKIRGKCECIVKFERKNV